MKLPDKKAAPLHVVELSYALALLAWFIVPAIAPRAGALVPSLFPVAYAVPLIAVWKMAAFALSYRWSAWTDPERAPSIALNILSSGLVLVCHALHVVAFATSGRYFREVSPFAWAMAAVSVAYNAFFIVALIRSLSGRNESYREYQEFKKTVAVNERGPLANLGLRGIQRRLVFSFVAIILVVVVVLCSILLGDFGRTILNAVIASGKALAERTASVVKTSLGDPIAMDDYLSLEAKKNVTATFPFNTLSFYKRDPRLNTLTIAASTEPSLVGKRSPGLDAGLAETTYRESASGDRIEFLSPVILSGVFIGYVSVDYGKDLIYEPYFRTQVKVVFVALVFIYLSVFITYLFGRNIVFPILYLRMSVSAIAKTLVDMIRGNLRISSDLLQYKDRVSTQDEIKGLSIEIGNMTTVIRGMLPYVSASTLKHSGREKPITEQRDLAFLFTDIRGFTSLCEGQSPDEVVAMLNHYLELQSSLILENGGDIDKFVGDEIMAMFEGPQKELGACRAGLAIRMAMAKEKKRAELAKRDVIDIGIGINAGPVVFGSVGARDRMDFTSIGDTVNLAARLEGANKTYATKILVTETVHAKIEGDFLCREIDLLTVKGKTRPVRIYELLQEKKVATPEAEEIKKVFEMGLALYRNREWAAAAGRFRKLSDEHQDRTSAVFLDRIGLFEKNPPPGDWDGVFNLTVK